MLGTQTYGLLLAETLLLLFQFAGFLLFLGLCLSLCLFAGFALLVGLFVLVVVRVVVVVCVVVGVVVALVVLVATFALQLLLNRLVDSLRSLAQSDGGLLVGREIGRASCRERV